MRHRRCLVVVLVLLAALGACPRHEREAAPTSPRSTWDGEIFASRWRVVVPTTTAASTTADFDAVLPATLREVEAQLSAWRADSEVNRCLQIPANTPCPIASATAAVLSTCLDVARDSDGAFDITVAPVLALWGFSPTTKRAAIGPPSPTEIAAALARVDSSAVVVAPGPPASLTRTRDDVSIDATAVTDGAAAQAIARLLWQRGLRHFLVDVAGEVVVAGSADGAAAPWQVGLSNPLAHGADGGGDDVSGAVVALRGPGLVALSTSGSTRDLREVGGRTVSHIVDPRVGVPVVNDVVACTVVGPDVVVADALSTACMVLGPQAMPALLAKYAGTSALYAYGDGRLVPEGAFPSLQR